MSQLLSLFGFFSLVLVGIYWINRALSLFDTLIQNGHSAAVFLEFSLLTLPGVIRLVLPISAFAATVYVTNRMREDSELVVAGATGFSPLRGARGVLAFSTIAALLTMILTHFLAPVATDRLATRTDQIAGDVTAGLLKEGRFLHPSPLITVFIRAIEDDGRIVSLMLSDRRNPEMQTLYTAESAYLVRREDGPKLLMFEGLAENLDTRTNRLGITRFEEFAFDVTELFDITGPGRRKLGQIPSATLLTEPARVIGESNRDREDIAMELHERTTQGLQTLIAPLLGFAIMMLGGFSRFSAWRQVLAAIVALIIYDLADNLASGLVNGRAALWPLLYLPTVLAGAAALGLLLQAGSSRRVAHGAAP
ncbi:LptF/LptG family permease [Palleronia caenipelagi]|nr:LptF/LptG family permease [Palleronia caenipelagi]